MTARNFALLVLLAAGCDAAAQEEEEQSRCAADVVGKDSDEPSFGKDSDEPTLGTSMMQKKQMLEKAAFPFDADGGATKQSADRLLKLEEKNTLELDGVRQSSADTARAPIVVSGGVVGKGSDEPSRGSGGGEGNHSYSLVEQSRLSSGIFEVGKMRNHLACRPGFPDLQIWFGPAGDRCVTRDNAAKGHYCPKGCTITPKHQAPWCIIAGQRDTCKGAEFESCGDIGFPSDVFQPSQNADDGNKCRIEKNGHGSNYIAPRGCGASFDPPHTVTIEYSWCDKSENTYCSRYWGSDHRYAIADQTLEACQEACTKSSTCWAISYGRSDGDSAHKCVLCRDQRWQLMPPQERTNQNWDLYGAKRIRTNRPCRVLDGVPSSPFAKWELIASGTEGVAATMEVGMSTSETRGVTREEARTFAVSVTAGTTFGGGGVEASVEMSMSEEFSVMISKTIESTVESSTVQSVAVECGDYFDTPAEVRHPANSRVEYIWQFVVTDGVTTAKTAHFRCHATSGGPEMPECPPELCGDPFSNPYCKRDLSSVCQRFLHIMTPGPAPPAPPAPPTPAAPTPAPAQWYFGQPFQNCNEVCANQHLVCDLATIKHVASNEISTEADLQALNVHNLPQGFCKTLAALSNGSPGSYLDGNCRMYAEPSVIDKMHCAADKHPLWRSFCACKAATLLQSLVPSLTALWKRAQCSFADA